MLFRMVSAAFETPPNPWRAPARGTSKAKEALSNRLILNALRKKAPVANWLEVSPTNETELTLA